MIDSSLDIGSSQFGLDNGGKHDVCWFFLGCNICVLDWLKGNIAFFMNRHVQRKEGHLYPCKEDSCISINWEGLLSSKVPIQSPNCPPNEHDDMVI